MIDSTAFRLDGKVALVTGGTRGIGRGICEAFAAAGATVVVNARKPDELEETVGALSAVPGVGGVSSVRGSAADPDTIAAMVTHCVTEHGRLDVLVNNAATNPQFGPLIEADMATVAKVWEVNLAGPLRLMQEVWRGWMREHGGVVLNVVSVGGLRPGPFIGAYNVGKAALTHMTKQLAMELAPGVRVNAIAPGLVKTDFARALWEPNEDASNKMQALGRIGVPDDIAAVALLLCSDASSWMTGDVVVVDGGAAVSMRGAAG